MTNRSKSTLFLIEQLIVVAVFAICAMACVRILTTAYFYTRDSMDISHALVAAENAAESFKAVSGNIQKTADFIGGDIGYIEGSEAVIVHFDSNWHTSNIDKAHYVLHLVRNDESNLNPRLTSSHLSVSRLTGNEEVLVSFEVVSRREGGGR